MDTGSTAPQQPDQFKPAPPTPGGAGLQSPPPAAPYSAPYASAPPPASRPRKNWTPCYVSACVGLLLVLALSVWLAIWAGKQFGGSFIGDVMSFGVKMQEAQTTVASTAIESIKAEAVPVTAEELVAQPEAYRDQWVAITGVLISEPSQSRGQTSYGPASGGFDGMAYPLSESVIVFDTSGAPAVAHMGDTVTGYGKVLELDMSEMTQMPFVGRLMEDEMKNDPELQGKLKIHFVVAKQVELVSSAAPDAQPDAAAEPAPSDETDPPPA